MSLTKLRQSLHNHKYEIYLGLFAAGCTTILYGLYKDQQITVQFDTFQRLIGSNLVNEAVLKDNQLYFQTMMPEWFKLNHGSVSYDEILDMLENVSIVNINTGSVFEKYKSIVYGIAGAINVLLGKFFYGSVKKISNMDLKPSKILAQRKILKTKIQSIPRLLHSKYQHAKLNNKQFLKISVYTCQKTQKLGKSLSKFLKKLKDSRIFNQTTQ